METEHYLKTELYELFRRDDSIFEFLQSGSLDGIWYWDLQQPENEWMSPRFWQILGYEPEQKQHTPDAWMNIIFPEDLEVAKRNFTKHCEDPSHPYDQIVRYRHRDGGTVWVRCRGMAVRDEQGTPIRMLGAHNDVTHLMKIRHQLAESENWSTMFHAAPYPMLMLDQHGAIALANERVHDICGYSPRDVVGVSIDTLVSMNWDELRTLDGTNSATRYSDATLFIADRDGQRRPIELGISRVSTLAQTHYIVIIKDISERIRIGDELTQLNRRLQNKNKEMEQFIYTVSHDLKAPLISIAAFTEKLKRSYADNTTKEQNHWFRRIDANVKHMTMLLDDLLKLSRVVNLDITFEPIRIGAILDEVLETFSDDIRRLEIPIHIDLQVEEVLANPNQLGQCLQNLLDNAIKYRHPERQLELTIGAQRRNDEVVLQVTDNGMGIESKHLDKVFYIFERLEPEHATAGTGVGLAIVKNIMDRHNGHVSVQSEYGVGSCFSLHFPIRHP